jgi:N-acetylglucosamine-6-phosphate deacetylase
MTAPAPALRQALSQIAVDSEDPTLLGTLAGINLEGPFLSPEYTGPHLTSLLQEPSVEALDDFCRAADGRIRLLTIAPELKGSDKVIAACRERGVVPSIGHTGGSYEECREAIDRGATHVTHLFNAMSPFRHRAPGAVGAALLADAVTVELILDGEHVGEPACRLALRLCGVDHIIAITDAVMLAGTSESTGMLGGREVHRRGARIEDVDSVLAGTSLTMVEAFRHLVVELKQTMSAAVKMTSTNAARVLGREDLGNLRPGCRADLVVLGRDDLAVQLVMTGGVCVHDA